MLKGLSLGLGIGLGMASKVHALALTVEALA